MLKGQETSPSPSLVEKEMIVSAEVILFRILQKLKAVIFGEKKKIGYKSEVLNIKYSANFDK